MMAEQNTELHPWLEWPMCSQRISTCLFRGIKLKELLNSRKNNHREKWKLKKQTKYIRCLLNIKYFQSHT